MTKRPDHAAEAIEHLYDVALDPTSYERMLDFWEDFVRLPAGSDAGADDIEASIARLTGHLERADKVLGQSMRAPPDDTPEVAVGNIHHAATFAIGRSGRLISANSSAAQALGITDGARIEDVPLAPGEVQRLIAETQRMLMGNGQARGVVCLRALGTERLIVVHLRLFRPLTEEAFVRCVTSEISWPLGFADQLQQGFGLSQVEIDLLRHLAEGHSVNDIATLRTRSRETVRVQVKSLLAKTGTRSQLELVRLALSTVESLYAGSTPLPPDAQPQASLNAQTCTLPDGRKLDYVIQGDPRGRPVLFMPMDFGFIRWPPAMDAEARRRRLRIIVPIRPGYGRSTPLPDGENYLQNLARDHLALLDHLKAQRLPVMSLGDDSLLALFLVAAAPHRFSTILCCAGTMPLTAPEQYERMGKWHRFVQSACAFTPQLLPFVVKAGAAMARRVGKRRFLETIYAVSPADTATFALPDVREALLSGSDVTLAESFSAHEAFSRELIAKVKVNWDVTLQRLESAVKRGTLKVQFFNGEQDPQIPADTIEDFRRDFPWIDFRSYPDAGQLAFYLKWRDVLDELERHHPSQC